MPELSLFRLAGMTFDANDQPVLPVAVAEWCATSLRPGWSVRTRYGRIAMLAVGPATLPQERVPVVLSTPMLHVADEADRVAFILRWL